MSSPRNKGPLHSSTLQQFLKQLQGPRKYLLFGISSALLLLSSMLVWRIAERVLWGQQLVLAAGNTRGASYIFSRALKEVVEANSPIRIDVCATDGTDDNIRALEAVDLIDEATCTSETSAQSVKADLITAQADRLYQSLASQESDPNSDNLPNSDSNLEPLPQASSARVIAILYQDHFQFLVNPAKLNRTAAADIDLAKVADLFPQDVITIGTPQAGGQRPFLETLSDYFGFYRDDLDLNLSNQDSTQQCQRVRDLDAVFRVRRLGNAEIQRFVACGWNLAAIPQAGALQNTKYPAYNPSVIPQGIYQGSPPIPPTALETIAIDRLLIAHQEVPDWVIETITRILFEHRQELRETILELHETNELDFDPEVVIPLISNIAEPTTEDIVQIHGGAAIYYNPLQLPFIVENADFAALLISLSVLIYSAYIQIKNLRTNSQIKTLVDRVKNLDDEFADETIQQVIFPDTESDDKSTNPTNGLTKPADTDLNQLTADFKGLSRRHGKLDEDFKRATRLDHEGFRAFSEAYKSASEMVEREIEDTQRKFSSHYVDQVVTLIKDIGHKDNDLHILSEQLDQIFIQAAETLTKENIVSRESLRTFSEAYDIARETIERKKQEQARPSHLVKAVATHSPSKDNPVDSNGEFKN